MTIILFIKSRFEKICTSNGIFLFHPGMKFNVFHSGVKRMCNPKKFRSVTPPTCNMLVRNAQSFKEDPTNNSTTLDDNNL